jgi:methanethiol S-methyltransferase
MSTSTSTATALPASRAARLGVLVYGVLCYAVFLATFLYAVGFIGGFLVPTQLDAPVPAAAATAAVAGTGTAGGWSFGRALAIDVALLGLFAVQHSVMARPWFKRRWTRLVPPAAERSTYVLASSLALIALFAWWQPLGGVVWELSHPAARAVAWGLFGAGWLLVLVSTFLIDHFELFGLAQVWRHWRGTAAPAPRFVTPWLYGVVRHPLYVGWLLVFWATPRMTGAHLLFAVATSAYILLAIRWEERDLMEVHPEYAEHRRRVPMLLPLPRRR